MPEMWDTPQPGDSKGCVIAVIIMMVVCIVVVKAISYMIGS